MFGDGDRLYRESSRAVGDKEELQAATVDAECSTGRRTITLVPLPSPSELISRLPPCCKTGLIQQRRMHKMRNCADLCVEIIDQRSTVSNGADGFAEPLQIGFDSRQIHS